MYTPQNQAVFVIAYNGAIGGALAGLRNPTSQVVDDPVIVNVVAACYAFSIQLDTVRGP
jgi:hypothetical protein